MQVNEILKIKGTVLYTIAPNKSLAEAVAIMTEQDLGSLVVFEHGRMAGMLTFREVLRAVNQAGANWGVTMVGNVMLPNPMTTGPDTQVEELRRLMIEHHMRYLPVMEDTTLVGVISFHDVARAMLEEQSFENRMLKSYINDWPAGVDGA